MRFINGIVKFFNSIINLIISAIVVFAIIIGGYAIYDINSVYNKANVSQELSDLKPGTRNFSIKNLQEINPDICAWVRIDGTNIDYPVLQGKDNTIYMSKDYKKEYSAGGSIFLDYRNNKNFEDDYSILYGHNMKADLMFSDVKKFIDKSFFDTNTTGRLYTENEVYKLHIYAITEPNAHDRVIYDIGTNANGKNSDILKHIDGSYTNKSSIECSESDKLIALSTCSSAGTDERAVLIAKLEKVENSEELIQIESDINKNIDVQKEQKHGGVVGLSARGKSLLILTIVVIIIFIIAIKSSIKNKSRNSKKNMKHSASNNKKMMQKMAKQQYKSDKIEQRNMERLLEIERLQKNRNAQPKGRRARKKGIHKKGKH